MALRLRLATFNVESLDDRPERPLAQRIEILRPQLLRLRADVLCLQEVNAQRADRRTPRALHALDRLLAETPYARFHRFASASRESGEPLDLHNLVVLSRFPFALGRQIWHDLVPPPAYRMRTALPPPAGSLPVEWDRPILHVALAPEGGRRVHVLNLHLRAPLASHVPGQKEGSLVWRTAAGWAEGFFLAAVKRAGQALETRLVIDELLAEDRHALIAVLGDFNAELHEVPVRIVMAGEGDTGSGRLAAGVMVPVERAGEEARAYSVVHGGRPSMLDHVLVSRALLAFLRHAEVHSEGLADEAGPAAAAGAPVSFHAPVVAEFEFPD